MTALEPALRHRGGVLFSLDEPYAVSVDGATITINRGYVYDLASVPRPLWPFISPFDLSSSAALLHDFLYATNGLPRAACVPGRTFTRLQTDRAFLAVMRERGVPGWRYRAAYAAVRAAGGKAWRRHARGLVGARGLISERPPVSPLAVALWLRWVMRGREVVLAA